MNTIFIIVIMVYLKKKFNINAHCFSWPEHKLIIVSVRIISRNWKELSWNLSITYAPPSTPHLIKNQQHFLHASSLMIKCMSQLYKTNKTPTIIYCEHCCILQHFKYPDSQLMFSMSFCSRKKRNNYFRDEKTQLYKMRFAPKHTAYKKQ